MLKLLAFCNVVCDVACNIARRFKADRLVQLYQHHSAIKLKAMQPTKHHVMLFREKGADQVLAVRTRGVKLLNAQVLLLFSGDLSLDGLYLMGVPIVVVAHA